MSDLLLLGTRLKCFSEETTRERLQFEQLKLKTSQLGLIVLIHLFSLCLDEFGSVPSQITNSGEVESVVPWQRQHFVNSSTAPILNCQQGGIKIFVRAKKGKVEEMLKRRLTLCFPTQF